LFFKIQKHGFKISKWGPEKSGDLSGAILASSENRKGRLKFPEEGLTKENTKAFIIWLWAWIK
jgi:yeast amino acid transporter